MDGVLSQEEISALLAKDQGSADKSTDSSTGILSDSDKDAIGEVANISMGTAATTLSSLVNRKVEISTPVVDHGATGKTWLMLMSGRAFLSGSDYTVGSGWNQHSGLKGT